MYLKYLDEDPLLQHWGLLSRILLMVREAEGNKSAFRTHAVKLVAHEHISVSGNAIKLLIEIGNEQDATVVIGQLKRRTNDLAYFNSILATLSTIGTEKEIETLEAERKAGFLKDYPRFWAKVDECEKAIRERAAKKKEKDLKATPPDKK